MGNDNLPEKTYSEKDVRAIIASAIKRQEAARRQQYQEGLSLEEIQRLAAEVGVEPDFVRAAVANLGHEREGESGSTFLSAPLSFKLEREVASPLNETAIAVIVREIRDTLTSARGRLETIGNPSNGQLRDATPTMYVSAPILKTAVLGSMSGSDITVGHSCGTCRVASWASYPSWCFLSGKILLPRGS